jgi:2'-5' RNA ligase
VAAPEFSVVVQGIGQFGTGHRTHTLWAGVESNPALLHLQAKIESAVVRAGFPPETRKFTPHITLARVKAAPPERLIRFLAANALFHSLPMAVTRFALIESLQGRGGPVYHQLCAYPLGNAGEFIGCLDR